MTHGCIKKERKERKEEGKKQGRERGKKGMRERQKERKNELQDQGKNLKHHNQRPYPVSVLCSVEQESLPILQKLVVQSSFWPECSYFKKDCKLSLGGKSQYV